MSRALVRSSALLPILTLTMAFAAPSAVHASGWTQPKGGIYAKISSRLLSGDSAFTTSGAVVPIGLDYTDLALGAYVEYGLLDGLTLVASGSPVGFQSAETSAAYVGPLALGLRQALIEGPVALAVEANVEARGWSLGDATTGIGDLVGDAEGLPGSGFEIRPAIESYGGRAHLGLGVPLGFGWAAAHGGIDLQSNDLIGHAIYGGAQLGFSAGGFVGDLHVTTRVALGDGPEAVRRTQVIGNGRTTYVGFGLAGSYWFTEHFAVNAGFDGAFLAESNAATPAITFGVEFR